MHHSTFALLLAALVVAAVAEQTTQLSFRIKPFESTCLYETFEIGKKYSVEFQVRAEASYLSCTNSTFVTAKDAARQRH